MWQWLFSFHLFCWLEDVILLSANHFVWLIGHFMMLCLLENNISTWAPLITSMCKCWLQLFDSIPWIALHPFALSGMWCFCWLCVFVLVRDHLFYKISHIICSPRRGGRCQAWSYVRTFEPVVLLRCLELHEERFLCVKYFGIIFFYQINSKCVTAVEMSIPLPITENI